MFSSNLSNGISNNPNANYSSNSYPHCPSFLAGCDHQLDPLTGLILPVPAANHQSLTNMASTGNGYINHNPSNFIQNSKNPGKRDRHSKIFTAQGLRDRRVRLSTEIAREFFDLQDKLGLDKASKTLEWLFNKSRAAIEELAEMKNQSSEGESEEATVGSRNKRLEGISEEKKIMEKLAKESRDKARARARQRTREKEGKKIADTSPRPQILTQFRSWSQIKACDQESTSYVLAHDQVQEHCPHTLSNQAPIYDFNLPQNWEIIGAMPHQYSTFCAVTKSNFQMKFK